MVYQSEHTFSLDWNNFALEWDEQVREPFNERDWLP